MEFAEMAAAVEALPEESRWWFAAHQLERQFHEAEFHPIPRTQLTYLPALQTARLALWARAETGATPSPGELADISRCADDFDQQDPWAEDVLFVFDPVLHFIALSSRRSVRLFTDPAANTGRYFAGFCSVTYQCMSVVYADFETARVKETAVADASIELLQRIPAQSLTRRLFDEIPDWERGAVEPHYARGLYDSTGETY